MISNRLKLVFKWSVFLALSSIGLSLLVIFLSAVLITIISGGSIKGKDLDLTGSFIGGLSIVPLYYIFCFKAANEAYEKNVIGPKQKGLNITMSVVAFAILIQSLVFYLLTRQFNISFGVLPIIIAFYTGSKADEKYVESTSAVN